MQNSFKRDIFDRYDGWRVRNVDPVFGIVPFILRTRLDSQNLFNETLPLETLEKFIRSKNDELPGLTLMHVLIAAAVRLISQRPYLNRFIVWNKIYARNTISVSIIVKKELSDKGEETLIKPEFSPYATLQDVVKTVTEEVAQLAHGDTSNAIDSVTGILKRMPAFIMRLFVFILFTLDKIGMLPKALHKISPWHCSFFLTNLGSLGIGPVYHHLYEFGTCSIFVAMGNKTRGETILENGEKKQMRFIGLKVVSDERICDGHYFALSMRQFRKLLLKPESLLTPPSKIVLDDGVDKKPLNT